MINSVRRLYDALNAKRLDQFNELFGPDFVNHVSADRAEVGVDAFIHTFDPWLEAMPDFHAEIISTVEQNDRVAVRSTFTGTHLGSYLNAAPTGKPVRWTGIAIFRFDDEGKIVERWQDIDTAGLLMQLGVIPAPPPDDRDIARRVYEDIWSTGQLSLVDSLISEDFVDHNAPPGTPKGRDGFRQVVQMYRTAFPDLSVAVDQTLEEGDRVALRMTAHGKHKGAFLGIAPTNRAVTFTGMAFVRIQDGKIAERWGLYDMGGLMAQLTQPGQSQVEKNMDLIVRYFDTIWNTGQFEREPEFVAKDVIVHQSPIPGLAEGIAGPLQIVGTFRAAIPDIHVDHTVLFGEGNKVVHRWEAKGHHTAAPLFGAIITNKEIIMTGINTFRIEDGHIVERWGHMDILGLLQQLGLAPTN